MGRVATSLALLLPTPILTGQVLNSSRQDGWTSVDLSVKLAKNAPVGYIQDQIMLETSEGQSLQMPLEIEGRVVANLSVSPSTLFMGVVQPGKTVTKPLIVKGTRPFKVLSVTCDDKSFTFEAGQETKAVHVIPVTFAAGPTEGKIIKSIRIATDLGQATADVSVYAEISSPDGGEREIAGKIVLSTARSLGYSPPILFYRFSSRKARRMYGSIDLGQLCVLCSVHGCGLVSAALARITEGGRWQGGRSGCSSAFDRGGVHDRCHAGQSPRSNGSSPRQRWPQWS